jgi:hypothetical protein
VGILVVQDDVAGCFEYYADLAEGLDTKQKAPVSLPMETFKSFVLKEPLGVVALITPWYLMHHCVIHLCLFLSFLCNVYLLVIKIFLAWACQMFLNESLPVSSTFFSATPMSMNVAL